MELKRYPYNYIVILQHEDGRFDRTYQTIAHDDAQALKSVLEAHREVTLFSDGRPRWTNASVVRLDTLVEFTIRTWDAPRCDPKPVEFEVNPLNSYAYIGETVNV